MFESIKSLSQAVAIVFLLILGVACSPQSRGSRSTYTGVVANSVLGAPSRKCEKSKPQDPVIYTSDFKWGFQLNEMLIRYTEMYQSPKRLFNHAYYDETSQSYVMDLSRGSSEAKQTRLSQNFLKSVRQHIEVSLERHYTDAIFFPDMGHSHLYIPSEFYRQLEIKYPDLDQLNMFYEEVFANKDVKVLYHTAEQLSVTVGEKMQGELSSDKYLQWRYYSRNVVAQNDGSDNVTILFDPKITGYNTIRDSVLPGYTYYGAGFNLSANSEGCFEFTHKGQTYYYDLSFDDLQFDPSHSNGQDGM